MTEYEKTFDQFIIWVADDICYRHIPRFAKKTKSEQQEGLLTEKANIPYKPLSSNDQHCNCWSVPHVDTPYKIISELSCMTSKLHVLPQHNGLRSGDWKAQSFLRFNSIMVDRQVWLELLDFDLQLIVGCPDVFP